MVEKSHTAGWWPDLYQPLRSIGQRVADWFAPRSDASALEDYYGHCQSKFSYFAKTSEPDFAAIDFPAFFRVDLSGSMAALSI